MNECYSGPTKGSAVQTRGKLVSGMCNFRKGMKQRPNLGLECTCGKTQQHDRPGSGPNGRGTGNAAADSHSASYAIREAEVLIQAWSAPGGHLGTPTRRRRSESFQTKVCKPSGPPKRQRREIAYHTSPTWYKQTGSRVRNSSYLQSIVHGASGGRGTAFAARGPAEHCGDGHGKLPPDVPNAILTELHHVSCVDTHAIIACATCQEAT